MIVKEVADGRAVYVYEMTFGKGRLGIGPKGSPWIDDSW